MAIGLIQSFNGDGSTKVFQVTGEILSKNHIGVWFNNNGTRENTNTYDVFGNTIVFKVAPISGVVIKIAVSDDGEGLDNSPSEINILQSYLEEIDLVADYVDDIARVATELNSNDNIETVGSDLSLGVNSEIRRVNLQSSRISIVASNIQSIIDTANIQDATVVYVPLQSTAQGYVEWNKISSVITFGIPQGVQGANGANGLNGLTPNYIFSYNSTTGNLEYSLSGYTNETNIAIEEW